MRHQVTIAAHMGAGANGDTWAAPVTVRAHVEDKNTVVINGVGQEVPSTAQAWLDPDVSAPPLSKVTLHRGTPRERTVRVITEELLEHPSTPSHIHLRLG